MAQNSIKLQGRKSKALYPFRATLNDEISFKPDDIIILIQASDDGTWYEGTLNNKVGWFPSNYVEILDEEIRVESTTDQQLKLDALNEILKAEEDFMDNINKFLKVILIPIQVASETILSPSILKQMQNNIDKILEIHSNFQQTLKELPRSIDARIGSTFLQMATQFKPIYESYAKTNPKCVQAINKQKDALNKYFELNRHLTQSAVIYTIKSLASPFKQLEIYVKLLKEIQRLTEDYHVDRGDLNRSVEFYEELLLNTHELKNKKEYELEIMSCRINHLEEDLFRNGESLFLSSVLIIYENCEKKDRILILFPYYLIILSHNTNKTASSGELNFETKIHLVNNNLQISRVDGKYDNCKYCFEISGPLTPRLVIVCSTLFDLKTWIELLTNIVNKTPNKTPIPTKTILSNQTDSQKSLIKSTSPITVTQQSSPLSPSVATSQAISVSPQVMPKKQFSVRPHPPLIPHFQLPNDNITPVIDGNGTLKRFMYKKPQLSDHFGKYHGADDDLRLLNVIESYWKTKMRQSVNIQVQETVNGSAKTTILPQPQKIEQDHIANLKSIKVNEEKIIKLEAHIQSLNAELNDYRKTNIELKMITANLQKQLESEKLIRKKLEQFIKKYNKISDLSSIINFENEASI